MRDLRAHNETARENSRHDARYDVIVMRTRRRFSTVGTEANGMPDSGFSGNNAIP